ncbi:MAG: TlpA disulfide reductase family protein [Bacteroidota bacterium]
MKLLPYCCSCLFLFFACQSSPTDQNQTSQKSENPVSTEPAQPVEKVAQAKVPIYNYAQLAPIFEQKSDTTYVINFWATWCKPCVEELPYFVELHEKYKTDKFKLIFVSLDFPKQIEKKLIPFLEKHQLPGEMMVLDDPDSNTWINAVDPQWSGAIPATVVYNAQKRSFHEQSFENFGELDAIVDPFMRL